MNKISVIVPCHNYSNYLDLCLMSIFTQRIDFEVEILFSDDNSSDQSYGIAERISHQYNTNRIYLIPFRQEENLGEIENTKFLLSKCTGKYIAYIDADDYWIDPHKLQKQYDFMESNPEYSMCFTGQLGYDGVHHQPDPRGFDSLIVPYCFIERGGIKNGNSGYSYGDLEIETFLEGNYVFSSSRFFRNYPDLFQNYFYEFPYSDWPMNFELSLRGKIYYMNFPSYVYRIKLDSLFNQESPSDWEKKFTERTGIFRNTLSELGKNK